MGTAGQGLPATDAEGTTDNTSTIRAVETVLSGQLEKAPVVVACDETRGSRWAAGKKTGVGGSKPAGALVRLWAPGWDQNRSCPKDPKQDPTPGARGYWRSPDGIGYSEAAKGAHDRRRQVLRTLRKSGYIARRWAIEAEGSPESGRTVAAGVARYVDGPAAGLRVVDPWEVARDLARCEAGWGAALAIGPGGPRCIPVAMRCNRLHVCPRCASLRSASLAEALRNRITNLSRPQAWSGKVLATFTQRADPLESLPEASARIRASIGRMTRNKAWKKWVAGSFFGYEVTYKKGRGWHAHVHAILILHGEDQGKIRADIGRAWREASNHQRPGWGWEPAAGGCRVLAPVPRDYTEHSVSQLRKLARGLAPGLARSKRAELLELLDARDVERWRVRSWDGGWWRTLAHEADVYQACKYPTPCVDLGPEELAVFLAFARGRRFHEGRGCLRGLMTDAMEAEDQQGTEEGEQLVSLCGPHLPPIDAIAPGIGLPDGVSVDNAPPVPVRWKLRDGMVAIAEAAGLRIAIDDGEGRLWAPEVWREHARICQVEPGKDPSLCGARWWVALPEDGATWPEASLRAKKKKASQKEA